MFVYRAKVDDGDKLKIEMLVVIDPDSTVDNSWDIAIWDVVVWAGTNFSQTVVDFDNPTPPGVPDSLLSGVFQNIDFGQGQWRWSGPWATNPTNNVYFDSSIGTSRSWTFSPAPQRLESMQVSTIEAGTLTLSDDTGQSFTQVISVGSTQSVVTGWTLASTTVTVECTCGWLLGVDDITYFPVNGPSAPLIHDTCD